MRRRRDKDELVHEFGADHIVFTDKIEEERGHAARERLLIDREGASGGGVIW